MRNIFIEMEKLRNLNSGLGQFCLNIGQELSAIKPKDLMLNFYLPAKHRGVFGDQYGYINHSQLHKIVPATFKPIEVWHCTHQGSKYLPTSKKTKLILTIHDLNFLKQYSGLKRKNQIADLQKKINKAVAITAISKFTEKEIRENLKISDIPVEVIHNGNSLKVFSSVPKPEFAPSGKFIFTIGIISPKKNFHTLLYMLEKIKDISLIIAGDDSHSYAKEIISIAKKINVNDRLIMPGIISEEEKYWLYMNCEAFVFPSISEGFGLPVVEAMSCGKPVFISNSSSLPEIGGDVAYYFNNFDADEMAQTLQNGTNEFYSDDSRAKKSIQRSEQFSWKNAVSQYLNLYRSI